MQYILPGLGQTEYQEILSKYGFTIWVWDRAQAAVWPV